MKLYFAKRFGLINRVLMLYYFQKLDMVTKGI